MPNSFCQKAGAANRWRLAGIVIVWLLATGLQAQAATGDYLIDTWDQDNGLPSTSVGGIVQTPEGYLWVATYNGLGKFDGVRFVNYDPFNTPELKNGRVRYLSTDASGTMWISTFDGSMTSWRHGVFTCETNWPGGVAELISSSTNQVLFAAAGNFVIRSGPPDEPSQWQVIRPAGGFTTHTACLDAAGDVWYITTSQHLGRLHGTTTAVLPNERSLPGRRVNCLTVDPAGILWAGSDAGLARWDGRQFQNETPAGSKSLDVSFLALNRLGQCWVFANGHVRLLQDRAWVSEVKEWQDLPKARVDSLSAHLDSAGNLWFCHYGRGLLFAGADGTVRPITSGDGLLGNRIVSWFQDREGNVWVGADHGGLARLREHQFNVVHLSDDPGANVSLSVCEDSQGAVWMASIGGGLTRWQDDKTTVFPLTNLVNAGSVFSIYPDGSPGCFWLSADNEDLLHFDNGTITKPAWSVHGVKAILRDRRGWLWIGMRDGLACYVDGHLLHLDSGNGFTRSDVRALAEDYQGNIWIGTGPGDLFKFGQESLRPGAVPKAVVYHTPDNFGTQAIWSIYADNDVLWVGTFRGGLLRFQNGRFTRFSTAQRLPNDIICQILPDHLGNLWLGTYGGIFRVARSELNDFVRTGTGLINWVTYGRLAGLPTLECSGGYQPSGWPGADGRLWFATHKGVVSVQPDHLAKNLLPPRVIIEEMVVDGRTIDLTTTGFNPDRAASLEICPGKHYVEFHFTGLSFTAPEQVRFRYRLRGLDDQWVDSGTRRFAQYTFLRPGDYHFEVAACNNEGLWNSQVGSLNLRIQPHVWETWWFTLALVVGLAGGLAWVVRVLATRKLRGQVERLKQQQAVERDRARIAKDIHDDLGAGLTQIGLLTELTRRASPEALGGRLNQISETARDLTGAMDEIVWAVNPRNDTLDALAVYLCKFSQEFLSVAGIRCRLDVPVQLPAHPLTAETRHNLFLALKETLNNIVKHARATEVCLKLVPGPDNFTVVITDNGRGLPVNGPAATEPGRIAGGNGLANLGKRLQAIGGSATISSTPGQGVVVGFIAPYAAPVSPSLVIAIPGVLPPSSRPTSNN